MIRTMHTGKSSLLVVLLAVLGSGSKAQQPGSADLTFAPQDIGYGYGDGCGNGVISGPGTVNFFHEQDDGKVVLCGTFRSYERIANRGLVRIEANGARDASFVPPVVAPANRYYSG
ncbi:MAG TPA: delta-60 repeat domain-containing protein, partial [Flavobacteriales bacterium]|nr:delta-60 repeat domain-containing protein [Flavobacteriales bacterium]